MLEHGYSKYMDQHKTRTSCCLFVCQIANVSDLLIDYYQKTALVVG